MRLRLWPPMLLLAACAPVGDDPLIGDDVRFVDAGDAAPAADPAPPSRQPYRGPDYFPASLGEPSLRCEEGGPPMPILSAHERDWYSSHLAAAGEPSLYEAAQAARPAGAASFRFTWLRSFDPPVVIRIETDAAGGQRLIAKQLSGAGGYEPGHVAKTVERPLTAAEAERLRAALERTRIFDVALDRCSIGCDGAQWLFEAAEGKAYRFASLWTPREGPARNLGLLLMQLAGWDFGRVY